MVFMMSGCRTMDSAAKPVTLPSASAITAIEVTPNSGDSRITTVIENPDQIERFVTFVNSRSSGWKRRWDTFPAGMYTVVAKRGDESVAFFWPSPGHMGGREGSKGAESNRLRPLSNEDWQELEAIVEIGSAKPQWP
jgi:hypothetical protein